MIRSLTGKVTAVMEGALTLEVRGIGYLVAVPTKLTGLTVGEDLTLHTHLAVREKALDLYGFTTLTELEVFEMLLLVPKVGPKSALQILNQTSPSLLIEHIAKNEPQQLHKLSGIGKKTCENIVQALHKQIENFAFVDIPQLPPLDDKKTDAIDALVSLGYDLSTARSVVSDMAPDMSTNDMITQALKRL
jgi:Holliday junction DNA helicase RuvA